MRHNPSEKNKNCFALPDFLFLLLWLVSLSITVWLALEYGVVKLNESWQTYEEQQQEEEYREDDLIDDVLDPSVVACEHIVKIAAWCALFAGSLAFFWVVLLVAVGHVLITTLLTTSSLIAVGAGCVCLWQLEGRLGACLAAAFFALASTALSFWCCMSARIRFASSSLSVACKIVRTNCTLCFVAILVRLGVYRRARPRARRRHGRA